MSQIRRTRTIDAVETPNSEPLIPLEEVLTGIGWLAYHGTRLAIKGAAFTAVSAFKGGKALASMAHEAYREHATRSGVTHIVTGSANAKEALTSLATSTSISIPKQQVETIRAQIQTLAAKNDKVAIETFAQSLVTARQDRLHAQIVPIVAKACQAIGFTPEAVRGGAGLINANRTGTRQRLVVDVLKTKEGGIQIHTDAEGFQGSACKEALDALEMELKKHGVHCVVEECRMKPQSRPVVDIRRIGQQDRAGI